MRKNMFTMVSLLIIFFVAGFLCGVFTPATIEGGLLGKNGWLAVKIKTPKWIPLNVYRTCRIDDFFIMEGRAEYFRELFKAELEAHQN